MGAILAARESSRLAAGASAPEAFVSGYSLALTISAVVMVVGALVAIVTLRERGAGNVVPQYMRVGGTTGSLVGLTWDARVLLLFAAVHLGLALGLTVALFVVGAARDRWGPGVTRWLLPVMLAVAVAFFTAARFAPRVFLAFVMYEAIAMLVALATGGFTATAGAQGAALFAGPLVFDGLTSLMRVIALASGVVLALFSWHEVPERQQADHQACLLIVVAGLSLTAAANDLITLFLSLELISIPSYILLYLPRDDEKAQEAAAKQKLISQVQRAIDIIREKHVDQPDNETLTAQSLEGMLKALDPH